MDSSGGWRALSKAINGCGDGSVLLLVVYDYPQAAPPGIEKVIEAKRVLTAIAELLQKISFLRH